MEDLIKTAKEIDRILESGIEILPNSPIHEKLKKALNLFSVVPSSFSTENWKIFTPKDDEDVVVMEDYFKHRKTFDITAFDKMMDAINSIDDY